MEYTYQIQDDLICETLKGEWSASQMRDVLDRLMADPAFRQDMHIVTDLREARFRFHPTEYAPLLESVRTRFHAGGGRTAILVDSPHEAALSSLFQQTLQGIREVAVFSTPQAAVQWICLS